MKILLDNVNLDSSSGPNSFARKLKKQIDETEHETRSLLTKDFIPDVQLSFIASYNKFAPIVQRLDGIYFNTDQDFAELNRPIEATYIQSDAVIFQSEFNKTLTEHYFGNHKNSFVIHNGTDLDEIDRIQVLSNETLDKFGDIWCCASSWRPHKRLDENIRYFLELSNENDCLVIAGENPNVTVSNPRIFYSGDLSWYELISLYKRSSFFLHLAFLDHCPNVVVDARASGCHIICSSSGGTKEIAGKNSTIITEDEWDLSPLRLYNPPRMDFSRTSSGERNESIDIKAVCEKYIKVFEDILK